MQDTEDNMPVVQIIKIATCKNLSESANITYHIGVTSESEPLFRVAGNDGGGYFSGCWVPFKTILKTLEKANKPLTSFALTPLFKGKSINSPSFLFAALLAEGIVQRDLENPRAYVLAPIDSFIAEMNALIAAGTDLKVPAKVTGKGAVKSSGKAVAPVISPLSRGRPKKAKS